MRKFRLALIFVGRTSDPFLRQGCELYRDRIRRYAEFDLIPVSEERVLYKGKRDYILLQEARRIRERLWPAAFVIALDEKGKSLSSADFARSLEKWSEAGREMAFVMGGPYGLDEDLKREADFLLSLSTMTLAHGLARMVLLEQIYRAFTLLRGEPYHK